MGCSNSKLHSLPAISLCRDRCKFLAEALHHIHSLSGAHVAYLHSLESLGSSLHRFLDQQRSIHRRYLPNQIINERSFSSLSSKSNPNSHLHLDYSESEEEDENVSKASSKPNHNHFEEHVIMDYNFYEYCGAFTDSDVGVNRLFYPRSAAPSPPPPDGLGWDILNLFDSYEERCQLHLEGEKDKLLDGEIPGSTKPPAVEEKKKKKYPEESSRISKKDSEESAIDSSENKNNLATKEPDTTGNGTSRAVVDEIGREMQSLFVEASLSGRRVLKLLDIAKIRYLHNHGVTKEPQTMSSSVSVAAVFVGEEEGGGGGDLSSTLTKLFMWEKKLYHEVKAEGKLRILYTQKWRELKQLGSSKNDAAEAKKTESIRNLIVTLSAKLKIAFHVIDKVSMTLNSLRDEELWPWIDRLIHGFHEMWKTMLKCHSSQHKLVEEFVNTLDDRGAIQPEWDILNSDRHLEEAMRLRSDLHNWSLSFQFWINTQKRFTKALNGWLLRCIETQGELAAESSIDAPSVFIVCNQWSKALEAVSEKEVTEAANDFHRALEQHSVELLLQRAISDSKEQIKMEKNKGARFGVNNNNGSGLGFVSCGRNAITSEFSDTSKNNVQCCLKCTFEAMEKFGATSSRIYEELCGQAENCRDPQEKRH